MRTSALARIAAVLAAMTSGAQAQDRVDTDALRTSLTGMVSVLTLGSISIPDQAVVVSRSGGDFQVRLPLRGLAAPPDAAAQAVAHPDGKGGWDIASLAFPASGAVGTSIDQALSYTIGQQSIRGRLDPTLRTPSSLAADLAAVTLQSVTGGRDNAQAIDHLDLSGRLSATSNGRLDLVSQNSAINWHVLARDPAGQQANSLVRHVDGRLVLSDLDRAQGVRLLAAARSFMAARQPGGRQPALSSTDKDRLRAMLDDTIGLMTSFEAAETLEALQFDLGSGKSGTLGRMQMHMTGASQDQALKAAIDLGLDELSLASLSADTAAFVPHHLTAKAILAGLPVAPLLAMLRNALAENPDPLALQQQTTALLMAPGARAALESVAFDAGPVHVLGSARLQPRPDGEVGVDIHLAATGVDALLTQAQTNPELQGAMPLIFMAKGLGRMQGDSIVWDLSLGGGPLTVNGMPFGQPSARTR